MTIGEPTVPPNAELPRHDREVETCAICGQLDRTAPFFAGSGEDQAKLPWVVRCERCDLVFAHPQPSDAELAAIYDGDYYEQFGFAGSRVSTGLVFTKESTFWNLLDHAEHFLAKDIARPRLLDVGCGLGFSLLAASARGFEAVGLDPLAPTDPTLLPGRTIRRGTLETERFEEPFDIVTIIDAIEHVRDPSGTIRLARRALAPGGLLVLATNDIESAGRKAMRSRWTHFHRAHLWFFSRRSLQRIVEKEGFEVVSVATAQRVYNLDYIASILARGTNFPAARWLSRSLLRMCPPALRNQAWPPVPEGFVLVARPRA